MLKEIYAYGFRNPHTFSFNRDKLGNIRLLVGDIGRANIEEINLVENGGNYGWPEREGTFVQPQNPDGAPNSGYYAGVFPLPAERSGAGPCTSTRSPSSIITRISIPLRSICRLPAWRSPAGL